jgi:hypothetical protein
MFSKLQQSMRLFFVLSVLMLFGTGGISYAQLVTNGSFELSDTGVVTRAKGWLISVASGVTPLPTYRIVNDTVQSGTRAMSVLVSATGAN